MITASLQAVFFRLSLLLAGRLFFQQCDGDPVNSRTY
ncbi:hypothetical protein KLVAMMO172M3_24435 [Klebsiella variicola subsp. variicola]